MPELLPLPSPPSHPPTPPSLPGLRILAIALLGLLMLIPLFMAGKVVEERSAYYNNALRNIANAWGTRQTITGPILVLPYVEHFTSVDTLTDENGESRVVSKDIYNDRTAILLPEKLEIRTDLKQEHRQRGIYDALVYTANISLSGTFNHEAISNANAGERRILWDKAFITIGLDDTRAINTASSFSWNDARIGLEPGSRISTLLPTGFHIPLPVSNESNTSNDFKLTLSLRGSDSLFFAPLGENTSIRMTSPWTHPSFQGELLPDKHETTEQGFHAEWVIPHLARNYPQSWVLEDKQEYDLRKVTAGVSLYEPVSLYARISRAVKYGALFIGLTFLVLLMFELSLKQRLHVLQYTLVGVALSLFYLILLALAEHLGFVYAYLAASATTIFSITLYMAAILRNSRHTLGMLLILAALYGLLYLLLQTEDYALLAGAALLLLATGITMYVTRHLPQPD